MNNINSYLSSSLPQTFATLASFQELEGCEVNTTTKEMILRMVDHPWWRWAVEAVWASGVALADSFTFLKQIVTLIVHRKDLICDPVVKMTCVVALYAINPTKKGLVPLVVYIITEMGMSVSSIVDTLISFLVYAGNTSFLKLKELSQTLLNMIRNESTGDEVEPCGDTLDDLHLMFFMPIACKLASLGHGTRQIMTGVEKALQTFTRVAGGIKSLDYLTGVMTSAIEMICSFLHGDQEFSQLLQIVQDRNKPDGNVTNNFSHRQFLDLSIKMGSVQAIDDCLKNRDKLNLLNALIEAWKRMLMQFPQNDALIKQVLYPLETIKKSVDTTRRPGSRKFEPFHVCFGGASGLGKSTLIPYFIKALSHKNMLGSDPMFEYPSNPQDHSYPIQYGSKFFDGYTGQYCVVLDDIAQEKAPSVEGSSANTLIRIISCIPNNMEGAAVEEKINPFCSRLVLTTTNNLYPNDQMLGITSPEAFHRRRHMLLKMVPSTEMDPHLKRNVSFTLMDPVKPIELNTRLTFMDVLVHFRALFEQHTRKELHLMTDQCEDIFSALDERYAPTRPATPNIPLVDLTTSSSHHDPNIPLVDLTTPPRSPITSPSSQTTGVRSPIFNQPRFTYNNLRSPPMRAFQQEQEGESVPDTDPAFIRWDSERRRLEALLAMGDISTDETRLQLDRHLYSQPPMDFDPTIIPSSSSPHPDPIDLSYTPETRNLFDSSSEDEIEPVCMRLLTEEEVNVGLDKIEARLRETNPWQSQMISNYSVCLLQVAPDGVVRHMAGNCFGRIVSPLDEDWMSMWEDMVYELNEDEARGQIDGGILLDWENREPWEGNPNDGVPMDDYSMEDLGDLVDAFLNNLETPNNKKPIRNLIDNGMWNESPFFRCDDKYIDEATVDNKPLLALDFLRCLINLDYTVPMQGQLWEVNPIASVERAVQIIQTYGLKLADFDEDFLKTCGFNEFVLTGNVMIMSERLVECEAPKFEELEQFQKCSVSQWWSVEACALVDLDFIRRWRSFSDFIKRHMKLLMIVAVTIPLLGLLWKQVWSKAQATYVGAGVGRVTNYIPVVHSNGAISKYKWAGLVKVGNVVGSFFMIKDRTFIASSHSFVTRHGGDVTLYLQGKEYSEPLDISKVYKCRNNDLIMYTMSSTKIPSAPDSTKTMYEDNDVRSIVVEALLGNSGKILEGVAEHHSHGMTYKDSLGNFFTPQSAYWAAGDVVLGDSGSVVMLKSRQKLFGMVVARKNSGFYIERLPWAEIKTHLNGGDIEATSLHMPLVETTTQPIPQMQKSKLTVSGLSQFITMLCFYKPAKLRSDDPEINLLEKSMKGYDHPFASIDRKLGDQIVAEFQGHDLERKPVIDRRVLTFDEALNGTGALKPFEIATSPGLPWKLHEENRGCSGKRGFIFGSVPNRTSPTWEKACAEFDFSSSILGYACLKDELRPLASVEAEKTRSFIVLPAHYNLILRQYFGSFIAAQHARAGAESSCVGINPYEQWDMLYCRLRSMNEVWEDFDYTEWDRTLSPDWFEMYANRVSNWYNDGEENRQKRLLLMKQLAFAKVQIGSNIFQLQGGNKSGCSITAEVNTDIHQMLMAYTWIKLAKQHSPKLANVSAMFEHNEFCFYGDDQVKSTHPSISWFNGDTISPIMTELGMKITPGIKEETNFVTRTPDKITFLKRGFGARQAAGKLMCPLSEKSITKMLHFVHKSDNLHEATQLNMETACREMLFHGKQKYDLFLQSLCNSILVNNLPYKVPTRQWEDLIDDWVMGYLEAPKYW
jgi:hypothetical protein